jgi:hypothetical protein
VIKLVQQLNNLPKTGFTLLTLGLLIFITFSLTGCVKGLFGKGAAGAEFRSAGKVQVAEPLPDTIHSVKQSPVQVLSVEEFLLDREILPPESAETGSGTSAQLSPQVLQTGAAGLLKPDFSYHNALMTEDTEWFGEVAVNGVLTIAPQATLTIAPGTIIRFHRPSSEKSALPVLVVQGRIVANGSGDNPIVFRSNLPLVKSGDWQGIVLLANEKKNLLENCRVEGAEIGLSASFSAVVIKNSHVAHCRTGLKFRDSLVQISGGGAAKCGLGLDLHDSEADITGADFSGNRIGIALRRTSFSLSGTVVADNELEAVTAAESKLALHGNRISKNGSGITLTSCEGLLAHNTINENMNYGISLSASRVKVNANDITRNSGIGIKVADGNSVAWGNSITANGRYDLYNAGSEGYMAIGNWWGDVKVADVAGRIYDKSNDPVAGRVSYIPILQRKPRVTE